MIRKSLALLAALVTLVAVFAYFYHARTVPAGHYFDAVDNVVNAICISKTGADEYGNILPWFIRAFDDYRPPLLIYSFAIGGLFADMDLDKARIISMAFGVLGIGVTTLFIWRSGFLDKARLTAAYAFFFAFFLLSSWVMVPHRIPEEFALAQIAMAGMMITALLLIRSQGSLTWGFFHGLAIAAMLYAYYGTKPFYFMAFPLLGVAFVKKENLWTQLKNARGIGLAVVVALLLGIPTFQDLLGPQDGTARFTEVNPGFNATRIVRTFLRHVNPKFLFFKGDTEVRHHTQYKGELNQFFLPFYVIGIAVAGYEVWKRRSRAWAYILLMFLGSFVPVSLTDASVPHALRTMAAVIPIFFLTFLAYLKVETYVLSGAQAWKPWKMAALAALFVFGSVEAYNNFWYYHHVTVNADAGWTYFPDYRPPEAMVAFNDHRGQSINERYHRMVFDHELRYCDAVLNPRR